MMMCAQFPETRSPLTVTRSLNPFIQNKLVMTVPAHIKEIWHDNMFSISICIVRRWMHRGL